MPEDSPLGIRKDTSGIAPIETAIQQPETKKLLSFDQ